MPSLSALAFLLLEKIPNTYKNLKEVEFDLVSEDPAYASSVHGKDIMAERCKGKKLLSSWRPGSAVSKHTSNEGARTKEEPAVTLT